MEAVERGGTQVAETPSTYRAKLNAGERLWAWKFGLRVVLLVVAIIGIACIASALRTPLQDNGEFFFEDWGLPWGLITLSCSFIWGVICILVLLLRKRPVHPGAAVGIDLILWITLIFTALLAATAAVSISSFGEDGIIQSDDSSSGYYYLAPNGTWVYNMTSSSEYYSPSYDSLYGNYERDCSPEFTSCAEEDALINQFWHERNNRAGVEWTAVACQAIAVLLHFALFVWACCDTHARNSKRTRKDAEAIAERIILDLREKGQIAPMHGAQGAQQPLLERSAAPAGRENEIMSVRREGKRPRRAQQGGGIIPEASSAPDTPRTSANEGEESHGISAMPSAYPHGPVLEV